VVSVFRGVQGTWAGGLGACFDFCHYGILCNQTACSETGTWLQVTKFKSIESDRIDNRGSKTRLSRQAEHNSLDEIRRRILLLLLQPEATKMGSFGRKDVSQSRAGVCGKVLSPRDRLYYEVLFDDIPASNLFKHVERDHIATSKPCVTTSQCGVQKHNLQTDSGRSSQRRLVLRPPLPLFPAHSLLRFPKLVSDWDSFYRSAYFAIYSCFSRVQISETRGHRDTCIEKYERAHHDFTATARAILFSTMHNLLSRKSGPVLLPRKTMSAPCCLQS
jgi:hypothetical protein